MNIFKTIIMSILIITALTSFAMADGIVVEENKMTGFLRFLYGISETDRASGVMKKIYTIKRGNSTEDLIYIKKFRDIILSLPQNLYQGKNFTEGSPKYKTTSLFYYYAASSKSPEEFKFLLSSIIPDKKLKDFFEAIDYFLPIYEELYYKKGEKDLKRMVEKVNEEKDGYEELLEQVSYLYNPLLPDNEIKIILVPLYIAQDERADYKGLSIEAQSIGNLQILETILPSKNTLDVKTVGVHEIIHYYQELSPENITFQEEMKKCDPLFGKLSASYINEGMATAIQAYSSYLSEKKIDFKEEWYGDKIIDGYSKELYPIISEYIKEEKVIDRPLAVKAVELFKNKFPDGPAMKQIVFQEINIMTVSLNIMDVMPAISRTTRSTSIYGNEPLNGKDIPKTYEKNCTQIFVLKPGEIDKLDTFNLSGIEEIRNTIEKNKNFAFSVFDKKRGIFNIVFICQDCKKLNEIMKKLWEEDLITEGITL